MVKKTLLSMAIAAAVVSLAGCNVSSTDKYDNSVNTTPATAGKPGSTPSAFAPVFSPANSQVPLAIDFLFADAGDSDGTANTKDTTPPVTTAINKLDGFSTVAPIYIEFNSEIDAGTVVAGQTVFLVKLKNAVDDPTIDALDIDTILYKADPASWPTKEECNDDAASAAITAKCKDDNYGLLVVDKKPVVKHANPFSDDFLSPAAYEARAIDMNGTPAIQVLLIEPLEPKTKYMVIVTSGVKSRGGLNAGMSPEFSLTAGNLELPSAALEPVRGAVQGWQQLAAGFLGSGTPLVANAKGSSILSYTFTTGGTADVLKAMAAPGIFMAKQLPTIAHAEGAISKSVIEKALGLGADQATAEAQANGTLLQIAQGTAMKINAGAGATVIPVDANTRTVLLASAQFAPMYHVGLISTIANGQGQGLDAIVSKPQKRDYNPIKLPPAFGGTAVAVPYDDLFDSLLPPKVKAAVEEQITSIDIGEGAITQATIAGGGNQAMADNALLQIAQGTAAALNAANTGNPEWTVLAVDGNTRTVLKSSELLQPFYLAGLQKQIITSQVASQKLALSSKGSIYQGGLSIPNYLPATEAGKTDAKLGTWVASDNAAKALGLPAAPSDMKLADGADAPKNVTYRFPFAKNLGEITIPVMATLPDAGTCTKPAEGYPVVIYQHGITVDRTAGLLVGNALAKACVAMVAIDHAMHGVGPGSSAGLVFNVEKVEKTVDLQDPNTYTASPFAAVRSGTLAQDADHWMKNLKERHNNVGKDSDNEDVTKRQDNVSMVFKDAKGVTAEASVGASGDLYINLNNFARTRDAMRQTVLDMMNLNASLATMDVDGSGDLVVNSNGTITNPDLDPSKVYFIGHSLGAIIGTTFVAVNNDPDVQAFNSNLPKIQGAILGNGGGGVVKLLENSPSIGGAKILPGLKAAAGLEQGSADIEKFFGVMQAMVDSADPINFAAAEHMQALPILSYEAVGGVGEAKPDLVVPNNALNATVATAKSYLAGTDPLVSQLGIATQYDQSTDTTNPQQDSEGIRANVRVGTGDHSTFSNADPQATFAEIYGQIGSFIATEGKAVNVSDKTVLAPAAE